MRSVMLLFLAFSIAGVSYASPSSTFSGEYRDVTGRVWIQSPDDAALMPLSEGMPVRQGDRIQTAANSSCDIALDDGSLLHLGENTATMVEKLIIAVDRHESYMSLLFGKIVAHVEKMRLTKMTVRTPVSVAAVRGTEFAIDASSSVAEVGVFEGAVLVGAAAEEPIESSAVPLAADQSTVVTAATGPSTPTALTDSMKRNRERLERLRGRIRELKDRLRRHPPAELQDARQRALDRYSALREGRDKNKDAIRKRHERIKNKGGTS